MLHHCKSISPYCKTFTQSMFHKSWTQSIFFESSPVHELFSNGKEKRIKNAKN